MDTPPEPFPVAPPGSTALPHGEAKYMRDPRFSVMATAAGTSAIVSLLTLWIWTPAPERTNDSGGTVSVTYELLDAERSPDAGTPVDTPDSRAGENALMPVAAAAPAEAADRVLPRRRVAAGDDSLVRVSDTTGPSRIAITTQPEGASVTINGVGYGTTPLSIPYLPPGAKRIRVTKAGYETEERFYSSDAGRAASLRISLRELPRNGTR